MYSAVPQPTQMCLTSAPCRFLFRHACLRTVLHSFRQCLPNLCLSQVPDDAVPRRRSRDSRALNSKNKCVRRHTGAVLHTTLVQKLDHSSVHAVAKYSAVASDTCSGAGHLLTNLEVHPPARGIYENGLHHLMLLRNFVPETLRDGHAPKGKCVENTPGFVVVESPTRVEFPSFRCAQHPGELLLGDGHP